MRNTSNSRENLFSKIAPPIPYNIRMAKHWQDMEKILGEYDGGYWKQEKEKCINETEEVEMDLMNLENL